MAQFSAIEVNTDGIRALGEIMSKLPLKHSMVASEQAAEQGSKSCVS